MSSRPYFQSLAFCIGIPLLLIGCVIAPIPLVETEVQHPWSGQDAEGHDLAIEADQKNWYVPVLASPEGSSKLPIISAKWEYRYFLIQSGKKERIELTFLRLDGVVNHWLIEGLRGTPYLLAERISDRESERNTVQSPDIVKVDIVVFEGNQLKHRRTLASMNWSGSGKGNPVWDRFKKEADGRYVIYKSSDGLRRYDVWKNIDEPLQPGQETN